MTILVFGANGQVGRELQRAGGAAVTAVTREIADLSIDGAAATLINRVAPAAIINAAAYTNVDGAEEDQSAATRINVDAVNELANAAKQCGAAFVHISTDYVFDGAAATPLTEAAPTHALNVYGQTKLAGETAARSHDNPIILRTSWVYSAHGKNFLKTMLRIGATREALSIVHDQRGAPTPASAIARAALFIAEEKIKGAAHHGVYHFQGAPEASWAEFAEAIFAEAHLATRVEKITTREYPTPAQRPLYTVLDCSRILRDFGLSQPDWRADIKQLIPSLLNSTETSG